MLDVVDILFDVVIFGINIVPISYCVSVYGPMERYFSGSDVTTDSAYAGIWELVGVVGLCSLEYVQLFVDGFTTNSCIKHTC